MAEVAGGRVGNMELDGDGLPRRKKAVREIVVRFTDGTVQVFRPHDPSREQNGGARYGVDD